MNELLYWIWLSQVPNIGPLTGGKLIKLFKSPQEIYNLEEVDLHDVMVLTKNQIQAILNARTLESAKYILDRCERNNIRIIPINDMRYSQKSVVNKSCPILLYARGDLTKNETPSVGIVGPRRCTQDDKKTVIQCVQEYVEQGYTIVSGMAKGVDSYAHTACINYNGFTIAILGNGLDICYPQEHILLMESIAENGLLISEYPPGVKPRPYYFPRRNRLIASWSDKLIVISPGKNSGSMITAEYMKEMQREVCVL